MAIVNDVINAFSDLAPLTDMEPGGYDNVGLLAGEREANVTRVLCCLDATVAVIDEAIAPARK